MTHRQFEAWRAWEQDSLNRPDRLEYYLAQACCEVRRVMASKPSEINVSDFILEFKDKSKPPTEGDKKTFSDVAKFSWGSRMTMPITVITPDGTSKIYPPNYNGPRNG